LTTVFRIFFISSHLFVVSGTEDASRARVAQQEGGTRGGRCQTRRRWVAKLRRTVRATRKLAAMWNQSPRQGVRLEQPDATVALEVFDQKLIVLWIHGACPDDA